MAGSSKIECLANSLIGKPFSPSGKGPDFWNCWTLVRHISAEGFGVTLPDWDISALDRNIPEMINREKLNGRWEQCEQSPGAIAVLSNSGDPHHVGVCIGRTGIIHCIRGRGVVFDSNSTIRMMWSGIEFWSFVDA